MNKKILTTPVRSEDIEGLAVGDVIYLSGRAATGRDDVHLRVAARRMPLPVDIAGGAIFHAGPIVRERPGMKGKYDVISIGPTTSMRMDRYEKEFIAETGVKLVLGKGGMGAATAAGCREHKAIHAVFPGGCAVLAARQVEEVESVEWLDLGMPEAVWVLRVKELGPLIVSIDTKGNNLFEGYKKSYSDAKEKIISEICQGLSHWTH